MITSKLTSKAQTTIPQSIRAALQLREGNEIAYCFEGTSVMIRKAPASVVVEDPFGTFGEWDSEADRRTYADL